MPECLGYFNKCHCPECEAKTEAVLNWKPGEKGFTHETLASSGTDDWDDWATENLFEQYSDEYDEEFWEKPWTDEDEAALEEWEEQRRIRIAEQNEY